METAWVRQGMIIMHWDVICTLIFFFNNLHTVCFMHGLSIYEIKRICHRTHFFIISYGRFQFLANFLDITQVFNVKIK